ncbi:MAG: OadG family protein [Clostridiales bacterium]|jgi:sodium pump decarboxylase gamma subunit|nr:OadG family protein [Clostridiales bacterium]
MRLLSFILIAADLINDAPLGEKVVKGLQTFAMGLGMTFIVLIIIIGAISLIRFLMRVLFTKIPAPAAAEQGESDGVPPAAREDGAALVAVITAAVAAVYEAEAAAAPALDGRPARRLFSVKSIKPVQ